MVTMDVDALPSSTTTDELHYSRLIYTIGKEAFSSLCRSRVLIVGCRGLGAEIAKNLVLSGIKALGLSDDASVSTADLGSHLLLQEHDIGCGRASSMAVNLRDHHPFVDVNVVPSSSIDASIANYHLLIATIGSLPYLIHLNHVCRSAGVPFIMAQCLGLFSAVFVDLGDVFWIKHDNVEAFNRVLVASITQDCPATVTVVEEQRHGLEDGDEIVFDGIKGMEELNQREPYVVTVTGTHTFTIPEDTRGFGRYLSRGSFHKVKPVKELNFLPLEAALLKPSFSSANSLETSRQLHLHVTLQAIEEFTRLYNSAPSVGISPLKEDDIVEVAARAREIWQSSGYLYENFLRSESFQVDETKTKGIIGGMEATGFMHNGNASLEGCKAIDSGEVRLSSKSRELKGSEVSSEESVHFIGNKDSLTATGLNVSDNGSLADSFQEELVQLLARVAHTELCPLVAVTGGIAAQEVIKAVGKVYIPIQQWFYFDAAECAPAKSLSMLERGSLESRYDLQIALFGKEFQQKLNDLQWLVVGAGGIGCEVLKNLALMGVGCYPNGNITLTDMDLITKPNLTDQLLYRLDDIGRQKGPTAARALRRINPAVQIHALQQKFDTETENIFDSSFFQSISGVFSAVDTASSRLYIDMRCVSYRRPMIDGGRHGTMGSVQAFVPFKSEMYASSCDPPEYKESPICTLRNFPYTTEHTLRWAVDLFESLFKKRPEDVNAYLSNRDFQESMRKASHAARLPILETLRDALLRHRPFSFESCVHWARLQFEDVFSNSIKQLCFNFPEHLTTNAGTPFWSGTKRMPNPVVFNARDPLHMEFIVAASNLQATVYGLKGCQDQSRFFDILNDIEIPPFQAKEGVKIAISDNELHTGWQQKPGVEDLGAAETCESILQELPTPASLAGYRLSPIIFEKDDEWNYHAEFVLAAANLRALNYGIPLSDKIQARFVGGRIIPAIVCATAVVGGLMCIELYKIVQNMPLSHFRHSYFNLALPLFSRAEPIKAVINKVERSQHGPLLWTLWDKFEMDCVGMSLEGFLTNFRRQHGLDVTMISYGKSLLYAEFLAKKKLQERMSLTFLELISSVGKVTIPPSENRITLSISCTDAHDNDVEVPDVLVLVR